MKWSVTRDHLLRKSSFVFTLTDVELEVAGLSAQQMDILRDPATGAVEWLRILSLAVGRLRVIPTEKPQEKPFTNATMNFLLLQQIANQRIAGMLGIPPMWMIDRDGKVRPATAEEEAQHKTAGVALGQPATGLSFDQAKLDAAVAAIEEPSDLSEEDIEEEPAWIDDDAEEGEPFLISELE